MIGTIRNAVLPIKAIAAVDLNWGLGYKNQLLFHIKDDMQRFVELTTKNIVIYGAKTAESMNWKPLPGRTNVIITNHPKDVLSNISAVASTYSKNHIMLPTQIFVERSLDSTLQLLDFLNDSAVVNGVSAYICGGESIYRQFLPFTNEFLITRVHSYRQADRFFPNITANPSIRLVETSEVMFDPIINPYSSQCGCFHYMRYVNEHATSWKDSITSNKNYNNSDRIYLSYMFPKDFW